MSLGALHGMALTEKCRLQIDRKEGTKIANLYLKPRTFQILKEKLSPYRRPYNLSDTHKPL